VLFLPLFVDENGSEAVKKAEAKGMTCEKKKVSSVLAPAMELSSV
jgi:hypothetical protein